VPGLTPPAAASPAETYSGAHFGANNLPLGCENDVRVGELKLVTLGTDPGASKNNVCYQMRTDMNGLDSPQVDVLVLLPLTPTAERDMRIMRQAVQMWEGGIDYLAPQMGLEWLGNGVDFHITVDYFDPAGGQGGEFTTEPVVDPEIVVIGGTNPVGGLGIGIDPVANFFVNPNGPLPCLPVDNPFDVEAWEALPGFNDHHAARSGTYTEDCGDRSGGQSGGNVCFAVNTALDPAPDLIDVVSLFDLVAHEFGHCMTVGHVGDGAEGAWAAVPTNDIMAYDSDPPGLNKCVSTLDVEGLATVMSRYLDVDGDGIAGNNPLLANDQASEPKAGNPFQIQHPRDHLYASSTGSPMNCPQPDLGVVPGSPTDWTPTPVLTGAGILKVIGPPDGAQSQSGFFDVTGSVQRLASTAPPNPTTSTGAFDDGDDDATTPITEIQRLGVEVTDTHVDATIKLADLWPSTQVASPTSYSAVIDGRKFDSFIRYAIDKNPMTWDNGDTDTPAKYMPAGTSTWDLVAKTVKFHIPRAYLAAEGIASPYYLGSHANFGLLSTAVVDDSAPEGKQTVGVVSPGTPPDSDGDGISDSADRCGWFGAAADGCPVERVLLRVAGALAEVHDIKTAPGVAAPFAFGVQLPEGTHVVRVEWESDGVVKAAKSLSLTNLPPPVIETPPAPGDTSSPAGPAPLPRPAPGSRPPGLPQPAEPVDPDQVRLARVEGDDRIDTAVAASRAGFNNGTADSAVISRSDNFPDGLAGTSLAVAFGGPTALNSSIDTHLKDMGYAVDRLSGRDRFETAALVARAQPRPTRILVATGQNYPDALAAGAAAAQTRGTVLLSDDGSMPPVSAAYLSDFQGVPVVAIGGPAAAAVPGAERIVGPDRFATSVAVARRFFRAPAIVAIGSGVSFPDSLSGGTLVGRFSGPMLLSAPDRLSPVVVDYLNTYQSSIRDVLVLGGETAVSRVVLEEALEALRD